MSGEWNDGWNAAQQQAAPAFEAMLAERDKARAQRDALSRASAELDRQLDEARQEVERLEGNLALAAHQHMQEHTRIAELRQALRHIVSHGMPDNPCQKPMQDCAEDALGGRGA